MQWHDFIGRSTIIMQKQLKLFYVSMIEILIDSFAPVRVVSFLVA